MSWYWGVPILIWVVAPMIIIPAWYLMRRLLPLSDSEKQQSDEGEMRALRHWRQAGSPRKVVLMDPGPLASSTPSSMPAPDQRIIDALTTSGPLSVHQLAAKCRLGPQRLYPALQRLERGDAVVAAWVDQPRGRQRIYTLKQAEATQ